jgi:hypothetical protein
VGCQAAYEFLVDRSHPYDVAILVESLQHARHLQQLLPEWAIYGSQSKAAKVRRRAIVTETFAKQRGVPAQFVVRATGGTSDLPRRWLNAEVQLVIDLADAQCTATTARHQRYQELEYDVDPLPQEAGEA